MEKLDPKSNEDLISLVSFQHELTSFFRIVDGDATYFTPPFYLCNRAVYEEVHFALESFCKVEVKCTMFVAKESHII